MNLYFNRIKLNILYKKCCFNTLIECKSYNLIIRQLFSRKNLMNIKNYLFFLNDNYSKFLLNSNKINVDLKNH